MSPSKRLKSVALMFGLFCMLEPVFAQRALPNPLVQPPKRGAIGGGEGAPGAAPGGAEGAGGAPGAPPGTAKEPGKEGDLVPAELMSRVSSLFVSAIIGDVAVLRMGSGGGAAGAAGGQAGGGATPAPAGGGGGGSRPAVYYVRDAEPFQIFDRFRVLPRVQDTTVVLYALPDNPQDMTKRPQVVFRGSLDSLQNPSYTPSKIETGSDNGSYQGLISTGASGGGGGAKPAAGGK